MDTSDYLGFVTCILGVAITHSSAQWLFSVVRFRFDILLGWRKEKRTIIILALAARLLAGVNLIFAIQFPSLTIIFLLGVFISNLLLYRLMTSHFTAVFRVTHLITGVLLVAYASTPKMDYMVLIIVAGLCVLSYTVAGSAKLLSQDWRKGRTLQSFLASRVNGNRRLYQWLDRRPAWRTLFSWGIILFEILAPFLILTGPAGAIVFCFFSGLFHLGLAFVMRMNLFPLTWAATYPAVYYCSANPEKVLSISDNPTPMTSILMFWFALLIVWQLVAWIRWFWKRRSTFFYFQMFEFYLYIKQFPNPGIRYKQELSSVDSQKAGIWKDLPFYDQYRMVHSFWNPELDLKKAIRQVAFKMKSVKSEPKARSHFIEWLLLMKFSTGSTFEFQVVEEESHATTRLTPA